MPASLLGLRGPASRSFGERLPTAAAWGIGIGLFAFVLGGAASSFTETLKQQAPEALQIFKSLFPAIDLEGAGGFLELTFVMFGFILAGFAASTLISGWASDETGGRLEMLLSTPTSRLGWGIRGGLGLFAAIVVMTAIIGVGVALGSAITGGDIATPILGSAVIGLYALALAGVGLAFGGLVTTSFAGEVVAAVVIVTFLIDFLVPALELPGRHPPAGADLAPRPADGGDVGLGGHGRLPRHRVRRPRARRVGPVAARRRALTGTSRCRSPLRGAVA